MADRRPIHQRAGWSPLKSPREERKAAALRAAGLVRASAHLHRPEDKERKVMLATPVSTRQRLDLHNPSIDFAAASAGQCGFTHLPTGGICRLPYQHLSSCQPKHQADPR